MALVEQDKEKTFTMVFDKNYEALCLYAVKFTEDFWEAEDIVQESFVRFWEMYRDRLTTENARPLLYRITRNMCVDRVREKPKSVVDVEVMTDQLIYYFQPESEDDSKIDFTIRYCKRAAALTSTGYRVQFESELYDILAVDHMNFKRKCIKLSCQKVRR